MVHRLAFWVLLGACAAGCAETQPHAESPLEYTENAKKAYEIALEAYFDRDWEYATQLLEEVRRNYGYSRYARLAELRLADAAFHQEKFAEAIGAYKTFVSDYPNDPEVPYARYKIARAYFVQSGESILLPPLEERDLSNIREAYTNIRAFLADYPKTKHQEELAYMLEVVTGVLARHELYVARFYLRQDNFDAALARATYAIEHYANSGLEPEAMVLLGETYLKKKDSEKAREAFQGVLRKHPTSPFTVPASRFLAKLGDAPGEAKKKQE
jgi:outer membrane protein assembly factor BamD